MPKKIKALKAFLKALEIPFNKSGSVSLDMKIQAARQEKRAGTLIRVDPDNLWEGIA
ncbi:DUF2683 family protein [Dyadobacter psychrotolerans]|uniref:DUF2683 family protein n=1 Tax=Dyadobacter psychrotolerans TaxID=2541721 RepID=UPI001404727F|nr:DUF2683 family protein [Dyadobacter psychrotolerans]